MFFQLPKVSNDLIKWPHKDKNQTLNDTQQLIQSAAFCLFVSPLMILIICSEKIKQVKLSCFSWVKKYIDVMIMWKKM